MRSGTCPPWRGAVAHWLEAAALVAISVCAAGLSVAARGWPPVPAVGVFAPPVLEPNAVLVDARSAARFEAGHYDGAIRVAQDNWDAGLEAFFAMWEPGRPVVVYCDPGCHSAPEIARRLREVGVEPVRVLEGGFRESAR